MAASTSLFRLGWINMPHGKIAVAEFGGYGEAGRHWQAHIGHFSQVRAFAAQQVAQPRIPVCFIAAETINPNEMPEPFSSIPSALRVLSTFPNAQIKVKLGSCSIFLPAVAREGQNSGVAWPFLFGLSWECHEPSIDFD